MSVEAAEHIDDGTCTGRVLHDNPVNPIAGIDGDNEHLHSLPGMLDSGWGRIINITSNTVYSGLSELSHYVASKSGMVGLTRCLASEFGGSGITCNCVAPNLTRTEGTHDLLAQNPGLVDMVVASQAIPRLQETADLLGAGRFLASEDSGFRTGQTLAVDGGTIKR